MSINAGQTDLWTKSYCPDIDRDEWLTVDEAADIIGIGTAQLYKHIRAGRIEARKMKISVISRMKLYISREDVNRMAGTNHWKRWSELEEGILQALAYDPKFKWGDIGQALKRTPEACRCHFERLTYRTYGMGRRKG